MDHVTIEEENVVERYLMGQLAAAEAARFEEHYLDCVECLDRLDLSKRLHQGLKDVATEEGIQLSRIAFLAWFLRRGRALQLTLAGILLAAAILPWLMLARMSGVQELLTEEMTLALAPQVRTDTYTLSLERSGTGEEPSTWITLRSAAEWVDLALELPPVGNPIGYEVRLHKAAEEQPLWQSGPLANDASGRLTFSVHSSWLEAGDYVVELETLNQGEESPSVMQFTFRVRHENGSQ